MIDPLISITSIDAPMNVALSFWPGLNLPSRDPRPLPARPPRRSSCVQRLSRPRSARSSPPAAATMATSTGIGNSSPDVHMDRAHEQPPADELDSGPDVEAEAGREQHEHQRRRAPVRDPLDAVERGSRSSGRSLIHVGTSSRPLLWPTQPSTS